jgi:hypothetical protein
MHPKNEISDLEVRERYFKFYDYEDERAKEKRKKIFEATSIDVYRDRITNISDFTKDIKQSFTRFYNKRHNKRGTFWEGRFKSEVVQDGATLMNVLAYIDLNPVRAGMVKKPEDYKWSSIGYHAQTNNEGNLLSCDFGIEEYNRLSYDEKIKRYRMFLYEKGSKYSKKGPAIDPVIVAKEMVSGNDNLQIDRFHKKTKHFTGGWAIGTKDFIECCAKTFKNHFISQKVKKPHPVKDLPGIFTLKRIIEKNHE